MLARLRIQGQRRRMPISQEMSDEILTLPGTKSMAVFDDRCVPILSTRQW